MDDEKPKLCGFCGQPFPAVFKPDMGAPLRQALQAALEAILYASGLFYGHPYGLSEFRRNHPTLPECIKLSKKDWLAYLDAIDKGPVSV